MKVLEAPRTWVVYAGLGTVLWLTFGLLDVASNAASWRTIAYLLMAAASLYMFARAVGTIRRRKAPQL